MDAVMSAYHVARSQAKKLNCTLMSEEDCFKKATSDYWNSEALILREAFGFQRMHDGEFARQMTRAIETNGRMVRLPGGAGNNSEI